MRDLRGVLIHSAFGFGLEVRQARASGLGPDLPQRLGDILAVGPAPSPALVEFPASRQQAVGVLAFVPRLFADLVEDADPFRPVGACVRLAPMYSLMAIRDIVLIPPIIYSVRYYGKLRRANPDSLPP